MDKTDSSAQYSSLERIVEEYREQLSRFVHATS
jgi:hypothetical protein